MRKDAATTVVSVFQFADAERQEGIAELKDEYSEGKVTATFEWVTQSTKRHSFTPSKDAPQMSRTPAVPEGKKFFLAPSLVTKAGEKKLVPVSWGKYSYTKICTMETLEMRYETASTLELRRVLRRDNPVHRALLDVEAVARGGVPEQAEDEDEEQAQREHGSGPSSSKPRIKRERGGTAAPGPAIDLTGGMQRPRRDPNTVEACDLTADE